MSGAYSLRHLKTRFNAAGAVQLAAGAQWYRQAHAFARDLARRSGHDLETVCQVIAVLSPACRWDRNRRDAEALLLSARPEQVPAATYSFNRDKAVRILRGHARLEPSSPKTYSFYRNLLDPLDPAYVTIDRHAWRALQGLSGGGAVRITDRQYRLAVAAYRRFARQVGLPPNAVQAIIWLAQQQGGREPG